MDWEVSDVDRSQPTPLLVSFGFHFCSLSQFRLVDEVQPEHINEHSCCSGHNHPEEKADCRPRTLWKDKCLIAAPVTLPPNQGPNWTKQNNVPFEKKGIARESLSVWTWNSPPTWHARLTCLPSYPVCAPAGGGDGHMQGGSGLMSCHTPLEKVECYLLNKRTWQLWVVTFLCVWEDLHDLDARYSPPGRRKLIIHIENATINTAGSCKADVKVKQSEEYSLQNMGSEERERRSTFPYTYHDELPVCLILERRRLGHTLVFLHDVVPKEQVNWILAKKIEE